MNKIKVLVADSSEIYSLGLFHSLSADERIDVFNHTYNDRQIVDNVEKIKPDILLIGPELLSRDGDKICETIRELYPDLKVVVLISPENISSLLNKSINTGARGILPGTISPTELVKSIIEMATLGASIHPTMLPQILNRFQERLEEKPVVEILLSTREKEVLDLVAEGKSNRDIAELLFISENTVKGHIRRICNKLNIDNRVEMARYVLLNKQEIV